jgi:hypothetical protein
MDALVQWAAGNFTFNLYMLTTKIQGILWSIADIALVYYFLKIAAVASDDRQSAKMRIRFSFLWLSAILTPFLLITHTRLQYLILDAVICGFQYLILLYTLVFSGKRMLNYFVGILNPVESAAPENGTNAHKAL